MSSYPTALKNETFVHRADDDGVDVSLRVERTDNQLVDLVLAGDSYAFELLFDRHKRLVTIVASRYFRRPEEIEEIIQISFAKAYLDLAKFRGRYDRSLSTWLARITSNACFDALRSQKRKPEKLHCDLAEHEVESLLHISATDGKSAENGVLDRDLTEKLLSNLPIEDRCLLHMLYAEEMSVADIADVLGWSKSNVKIRAWR
ncbi:MAG: RNA polymerase sigma factor, partial [Pyrinomonadaceae bacterium]